MDLPAINNLALIILAIVVGVGLGYASVFLVPRPKTRRRMQSWSETSPQAILASVQDAIVAVDYTGKIRYWNQAAGRLYGYTFEEVQGQLLTVLLRTEASAELQSSVMRLIGETGTWNGDLVNYDKTGNRLNISVNLSALRTRQGKPLGMVSVHRNVTEQTQTAAALRNSEATLAKERDLLNTLIDSIPESFYYKDLEGRFLRINRAQARRLGAKEVNDAVGKTDFDYFSEEHSRIALRDEQNVISNGVPMYDRVEHFVVPGSGEWAWVLATKVPMRDENGNIVGTIGVSRDITDRMLADEKILRQNEYLTALNETMLALVNRLDLSGLLEQVLLRAGALMNAPDTAIHLVNPDDNALELCFGTGFFKPRVGLRIKYGEGLAGHIWQTGQTAATPDYSRWPGRLSSMEYDNIRSLVGVPLKSGSQISGVLCIARLDQSNPFDENEVTLLNRFAELVSIALDNARLYTAVQQQLAERKRVEEKLQQQNEFLAALNETTLALMNRLDLSGLMEAVLARAGALIGTPDGYIYLLDEPDGDEMIMRFAVGYHRRDIGYRMQQGAGFSGKIWQTGQPLAVNDYSAWPERLPDADLDPVKALMATPLKAGNHVIGVLGLSRFEEGRVFGEDEVALLSRFAELVSLALDNVRLYEAAQQQIAEREWAEAKLRQQNDYLLAFNETTLALINHLDPVELLETMLVRAGALMGTTHGSIYLADPGTKNFSMRVAKGYFQRFEGQPADHNANEGGVTGKVLLTGQPSVSNDYTTWSDRHPNLDEVQAAMAVPLKNGDQLVGILALAHLEHGKIFTADEVSLFARFGELASVALDNAYLYASAQRELIERTRVQEELRALNIELEERVQRRTAELQQEQTLLQTILYDMGEGVIYCKGTTIVYANRALEKLTSYRLGELIGEGVDILKSDNATPEEARLLTDYFSGTGKPWRGEIKLRRKDGIDFVAALVGTVIVEPDGVTMGMILIVRDITEEKQLQDYKARFIANASHELRTPLTNLKTRLYLMRKQPQRVDEHIIVLERVTERMIHLVEDLLDTSRFERGVISLHRTNIVLQDLIQDAVQLQQPEADRRGVSLSTNMPDEPIVIYADSDRFTQVIVNLTVNAVNYTPAGGSVSVELRKLVEPTCTSAVIHVHDTGIGIEPEYLPRLFEPFFRANEGASRGTGLGLSISKEIMELHDGTISVESVSGLGSTFSVKLTIADTPADV